NVRALRTIEGPERFAAHSGEDAVMRLPIRRPLAIAGPIAASIALALAAPTLAAERFTLEGGRVAIYNLAGELRVEPTGGSQVVVEVTRGGRDAGDLRIEHGRVRGMETLRVIYPSDRVVYPPMGRGSSSSEHVAEDGTFADHSMRGIVFGRRVT